MRGAMTPRERFLTALRGEQPDRVPLFDFLFSLKLFEHAIGRRPETYNAEDVVACSFTLGLDGVYIPFWTASSFHVRHVGKHVYVDEWGVTIKADGAVSWPGGAPIGYPIKTREDWRGYRPPDPCAPGRLEEVEAVIRLSAGRLAIVVVGPLTQAWWVTGLEAFSILLYDDPKLAQRILRMVTDYGITAGRAMAAAGVDVLLVADDHGGTYGPLISLPLLRRFVLPYFAEMVWTFRGLGLLVIMHNDGHIRIYLDDLVDTGIDAYQPVERAAGISLREVKERYASRLCPIGNVNNRTTLLFGTEEHVEREVRECIRVAGPGGGYILASDHNLHDELPLRNVLRMFEAAKRYGQYPLRLPDTESDR